MTRLRRILFVTFKGVRPLMTFQESAAPREALVHVVVACGGRFDAAALARPRTAERARARRSSHNKLNKSLTPLPAPGFGAITTHAR